MKRWRRNYHATSKTIHTAQNSNAVANRIATANPLESPHYLQDLIANWARIRYSTP